MATTEYRFRNKATDTASDYSGESSCEYGLDYQTKNRRTNFVDKLGVLTRHFFYGLQPTLEAGLSVAINLFREIANVFLESVNVLIDNNTLHLQVPDRGGVISHFTSPFLVYFVAYWPPPLPLQAGQVFWIVWPLTRTGSVFTPLHVGQTHRSGFIALSATETSVKN
jgi:hypothetical protein